MNVRMTGGMPPMGSNGMGPPRGAPMGPPPAMQMGMPMGPQSAPQPIPQGGMPMQPQQMPMQSQPPQMPPQQGGLGNVGGSAQGRQGFYQYMRGRREQQMQMQQMRQQQMPPQMPIQPQMSMGPFGGPPMGPPPMMPNAPVDMGLGAQMPSSGVSSAPQQFMYGGYVDPRRMIR